MIEHMSACTLEELYELRARLGRDVLALDEPVPGGLREHTGSFSQSDLERARVEVDLVRLISPVAAPGEHRDDGHTSVAAWCRAPRRWSEAETRTRVRLARLLA